MEKFNDILEKISQLGNEITALNEEERKLSDSYKSVPGLLARYKASMAVSSKLDEIARQKLDRNIARKILQNNARVALFREIIPVALEVLSKYAGKSYGEKTKQKISDEVMQRTNCRFYISNRFGNDTYEIYPNVFGNEYNITCGTIYDNGKNKPLLVDNKIQQVSMDDMQLYYISDEYVEDVQRRVEILKQVYEAAVAKQKELEEICESYRALAVGDLPGIYSDKRIPEKMSI